MRAVPLPGDAAPERRRLTRLPLYHEQFRAQWGRVFGVADLSVSGLGLRIVDPRHLAELSVGRRIEGALRLDGERVAIAARVVSLRRDHAGLEFEDLEPSSQEAIRAYVDPKRLGAQLRALPSTRANQVWFHGPGGTEIVLGRGPDGTWIEGRCLIAGLWVAWGGEGELQTGRAVPGDAPVEFQGALRIETLLIDLDERPDPAKLALAREVFLGSARTGDGSARTADGASSPRDGGHPAPGGGGLPSSARRACLAALGC